MIKRIKDFFHPVYRVLVLYPRIRRVYQERIRQIRGKGSATVVFLVSSLAMWKAQSLYERLALDKRFDPHIMLIPFNIFKETEKKRCIQELRNYFSRKGISFIDSTELSQPACFFNDELNPDIVFYPQPYEDLFGNYADFSKNMQRLSAYIPYAAWTSTLLRLFDNPLGRIGWRNYWATREDIRLARRFSWSSGHNLRAVGFILGDELASPEGTDVWKPQKQKKKRIIWAPHFSGVNNDLLKRGSFLWLADLMQEIAVQYKDTLQIAFKPHPRLKTELYSSPLWGPEKTNAYYAWWENQPNTQLESGQYIDLFKSSDAMIHDCGSFTIDYLYTGKPVLFASDNLDEIISKMNNLGKEALSVHEIGKDASDIRHFINRILQDGPDPKAAEKVKFLSEHLQVKENQTVADRIYQDLLKAIRFK